MVVRRLGKSASNTLCRAGLGAIGYYLSAVIPMMAAPDAERSLMAEVTPVAPTSSGAATSQGPISPAPLSPATPESQVEVEAPIPTPAPEEAAPEVVTPAQESLHYPASQWPVMVSQSPLFGTENIAQFSEAEMLHSRWSLKPHVGLATVYDGNVFISNHGQKADFLTDLSVGLTLRIGAPEAPVYIIADYTLTGEVFLNHGGQDSIGNGGYVNIILNFKKLTLGFEGTVQSGSVTSIDIGNRVHQTNFTGGVNGSYVLGDKISLTASVNESLAYYDTGYIGSETTQFDAFLNYQIRPKITIGAGGGFGYTDVQGASGQTSEDISARLLYTATQKVSFTADLGAEFRQFGMGGGGDVQPVFGLGVGWELRAGTHMELSGQRSVFASATLKNQNYVATGVSFSLTQRINDRLAANFAVGYENQSYEAAARNVLANRNDNFFYIRPGVQIHLANRVDLNLYYEYSENVSSGSGADSFQRDRLGAQINLLF